MARLRANLSLFWRWFTHWRKRYVWLRLALLLIVFAEPVHDVFRPTIRELVVIAIQGIDTAGIPKLTHYQYRRLRMKETKRLQHSLLARFDANHNGRLEKAEAQRLTRATSLVARDITQSGLVADLDRLLTANQKLGLADRALTSRKIRRAAFDAAQRETDQFYREYRKELAPLLATQYPQWRDYLQWKTWSNGGSMFLGYFAYSLQEATSVQWSPKRWLLLVVLPAVIFSVSRFGRRERLGQRFREDPELAVAPCPVCQEPTHDFGALRQQRLSRAATTGVVVALAFYAVSAVTPALGGGPPSFSLSTFTLVSHRPATSILLLGLAALILRWVLWPREVHACHRRPRLHWIGLAASACLVLAAAGTVLWFTVKTFG